MVGVRGFGYADYPSEAVWKNAEYEYDECFFSNQYADRQDLFTGLEIWNEEEYQKLQGTYPVIFLSFAAIKHKS